MKQFLTLLLVLLAHLGGDAQTFQWVKGGGSTATLTSTGATSVEATYRACTDPHGNTYALSIVGDDPVFADTFSHSGTGIVVNILFTSHTCNGQMRFAKLISGGAVNAQGIAADSFGNVYIAADLPHTASGTHVLRIGYDTLITGHLNSHQALVKYDTSGDLKWVRFLGDNTPISSNGTCCNYNHLALDAAQNPHLVIWNNSGLVFRPGDTSKKGTTDVRFDPAGNLVTVKHLDLDTTLQVRGVSIDPSTNKLYTYGDRPMAFPAPQQYKFLAALDTNRNLIRIDTLISPASISYDFTGIAADGYGHIYASLYGAEGTTIYRNDTFQNILSTASGAYHSAVIQTDTAGNVNWKTVFSGFNSGTRLLNMILSPDKRKLALSGILQGKMKCDIDSIISYTGEYDNPLFAVLDTAGYVHDLQQMHEPTINTWANCIAADRVGNVSIGGRMASSIWGGTVAPYNTVGGNTDFFIVKYGVDCNCPSMPVASFTAVQTGSHTYNFTYTGTPGDSVRWYFGDGTTSTALNPTHVFTTSGKLTVRCWVYTTCGRDLKGMKINLPCTYPGGASFAYSGVSTIAFNYTGSSTDVDSIRWRFGDGGTSPLTNPTHAYMAVGTYNVCVKVYSWCGVDSFCTSITVPCISAPAVTFISTGAGPTRNFNYTGSTTGVTSISWSYGDASAPGSGTTTSHSYPTIGIYTVCVTALNACGSNVYCSTVNVTCMVAPVALFNKSGSMANRSFGYTGTATGTDSVVWSFGDGGHTTGMSPSHTYAATGVFTVCVTSYSQCGNSTWCDTVNIPCLSIPSVTFTTAGGIHDSTKNFTYTGSTVGIDSVRWNFGDGEGFTGTSATHSYSDTGSYTVCAIAYSQCGRDTTCNTVIYRLPVGVAAISLSNVLVYPNPANGQLVIENAEGYAVRITDVVDKEVYGGIVRIPKQVLDISYLPGGVYIVQLCNDAGERKMVKVVKR